MAFFFMVEVPVITQVPMSSVETPRGDTLEQIKAEYLKMTNSSHSAAHKGNNDGSTHDGRSAASVCSSDRDVNVVKKSSSYVSLADRFAPLFREDKRNNAADGGDGSDSECSVSRSKSLSSAAGYHQHGRGSFSSVATKDSGAPVAPTTVNLSYPEGRGSAIPFESETAQTGDTSNDLPPGMVWWPVEQYMDEFFERADIYEKVVGRRKLLDSFTSAKLFHPDGEFVKSEKARTRLAKEHMDCHVVYLFRVFDGYNVEYVIQEMAAELGVGSDAYPQCGTVTVVPAEISRPAPHIMARYKEIRQRYANGSGLTPELESLAIRESMGGAAKNTKDSFTKTIGSRILVDKLIARINAGAVFSFDYLLLCIAASLLAGIGLGIDNAVVIVASMLVSPLMGPIICITFGTFIFDWSMVKRGLVSEGLGLLICVVGGIIIGLTLGNADLDWPTGQMSERGDSQSLWIGVTIAIPSGVGVALSVLGENTASLVGVAISAALLPPLVNAGQLMAFAALLALSDEIDSSSTASELLVAGAYSFVLTIVNILCIFLMALLLFKIKESTPFRGKSILFSTVTSELRRRKDNEYHLTRSNMPVNAPTETDDNPIGLERAIALFQTLQNGGDVVGEQKLQNAKTGPGKHATVGHSFSHYSKSQRDIQEAHNLTVGSRGRGNTQSKTDLQTPRPQRTAPETNVDSAVGTTEQNTGEDAPHHLTFHPNRYRKSQQPATSTPTQSARVFDLSSFASSSLL
eukprot:gb/GECG01016605.1/.p1 GENE.gb/GECG01016605.1/~~gb/GECG01016605.1/.p1  ORF type:complete len:745 (+),score=76.00 gb/GECG01016605.1/:1-2235(+)